ncbi:hypothetical protein ACSHXN_36540 [Streptomyces sp. HUAS TT11]|uniref:hypothetical protein n=1 Tax=Streptomyces sp. HUAS TT11 TaxID=3447508 RepID=UPI003F65E5BF
MAWRRNRRAGELAFYRCHSAAPTTPPTPAGVAGLRWTTKEIFRSGKVPREAAPRRIDGVAILRARADNANAAPFGAAAL